MKQKMMSRYLLGLGVLVAIVVIGTTLGLAVRNAASTSPKIVHAAPAISAAEIDNYLSGKGSPLADHGPVFVDKGRQYNIDPRLLVAIAGAESTFGKYICTPYNAWNWFYNEWCDSPFSSWDEGIDRVAEGLRRLYFDGGLDGVIRDTISLIGEKYCPGSANWVSNVTLFYHDELGGDLNDLTFQGSTSTVDLPVPYRSQWDDDSGTYKNVNCGPASLAMVLEYYGTYDTIANIRSHCKSGGGALSYSDMIKGATHYSFDSDPFTGWQISDLRNQIDNGRPVIVVVHYGDLPRLDTGYTGGHWMVVKGFSTDDNSIILHDPDYWEPHRSQGANRVFSIDTFYTAWDDCTQDGNPNRSGIMIWGTDLTPPTITFTSYPDQGRWYNTDQRIEWTITDDGGSGVRGFCQAWNSDPGGSASSPCFTTDAGHLMLSWAGDGKHTARVRAWDQAGNQADASLGEFWYDHTSPNGGYTSPANGTTVQNSVTLQAWADGATSGVNHVDFTANYDGNWHLVETFPSPPYESPYKYTWDDLSEIADQTIILGFDIYDNAGNFAWSPEGTIQIIKTTTPIPPPDTTPPTNPTSCTEANGAQDGVWQNSISHPVFNWSGAGDDSSGVAGYYHTFSTDPNGTSDYFTTDTTFDFDYSTGWPTGIPYYLRVSTMDNAGNRASWEKIFTFRYDPIVPDISFVSANGIPISSNGQDVHGNTTGWTFRGTANDQGSGRDHIMFGGWGNNFGEGWNDTAGTSSPWSYSQNGLLGHNRIHFWSVDKAGNASERKYIELYVDTAAPGTVASLGGTMGNQGWYLSPVEVTLSASDNGSGDSGTIGGIPNRFIAGIGVTSYRIDSGAWQTYNGNFTVDGDGTHTVEFYSADAVGNEESTQSLTIKIDTNPPTGSLSINRGASTSYSLNVVLRLSASDGSGSGVSQMRFSNSNPNWGGWEAYAPERAWKLTDGNGSKTVHVQFQDTAGNISSGYSTSILVDLYPDKPASQNYRIFKNVVAIGGGSKGSASYKAGSTTGQPAMGPAPERSQSSENFHLLTGYWAMQPWPLFGDFNHDCKVDVGDIMQVANRWRCRRGDGCYHKCYDLDKDGDIDVVDIMLVVVHWGETCP